MITPILKSNKTFFIFLVLLSGIFYWLSFTYPIVFEMLEFEGIKVYFKNIQSKT